MLIPHLYSSQVKSRCSHSVSSNNKLWLLRQTNKANLTGLEKRLR